MFSDVIQYSRNYDVIYQVIKTFYTLSLILLLSIFWQARSSFLKETDFSTSTNLFIWRRVFHRSYEVGLQGRAYDRYYIFSGFRMEAEWTYKMLFCICRCQTCRIRKNSHQVSGSNPRKCSNTLPSLYFVIDDSIGSAFS